MFSIVDGEGIVGNGAFTSCLRGVSKTMEPTINGESICGVDVQFVFVVGVAVVASHLQSAVSIPRTQPMRKASLSMQ